MIQSIIAVIFLVGGIALYFWSRRSNNITLREDPDVILGLAEGKRQHEPEKASEVQPDQPSAPINKTSKPIERVLLFIRAPVDRQYGGYELLQSLLACGLRFGENNIFHRHGPASEGETILFSIAAATQSGEFKLLDMGEFSCPGLSLFINLNQHVYPSVNFELMLDTARQLVEDLGGTLLDERQSLLTQDKVQQIREKLKSFETSQQTMELFV